MKPKGSEKLRAALLQTYILWIWLSRHPTQGKEQSPMWKTVEPYPWHCPCCNYASYSGEASDCLFCPLYGFWPEDIQCCSGDSLYVGWRNISRPFTEGQLIRRSKYAREIAFEAFRRWMLMESGGKLSCEILCEL